MPPTNKYAAVAVLPPVGGGRLQDPSLRAWLAQSNLQRESRNVELLARIVGVLGLPYPQQGLAALRFWGQTGERPRAWFAAADPVSLEARLNHLYLHALAPAELPSADLRALFDHLQDTLAGNNDIGFTRIGCHGYLRAEEPIVTAAVPPYVLNRQPPDSHMPQGQGVAKHRNLLGEIEMSLHEHAVNLRRVAAGQHPINSLWLWGGGVAPERLARSQPPLFTDDPLLLGYWDSANCVAKRWPGDIAGCVNDASDGFVAVTPEFRDEPAFLAACLEQLREALRNKSIDSLTMLFRDGCRADTRRSHELRFWRRDSALLDG